MSYVKKMFFIVLSGIIFYYGSCLAAENKGTSSGVLLRQSVGARALGMGEAYVAVGDDVNALFSNPAGLAFINTKEFSTMYFRGLAEMDYAFFGYALPLQKKTKDVLGFGLFTLQGGGIKINYLDGTSRTVNAEQDYIGVISYARGILKNRCLIGVSTKILHSTLVEAYKAQSVSADLGVLFELLSNKLDFGFAMQNLGTGIKYDQKRDGLPVTFKAGVAYKLKTGTDYYSRVLGDTLDRPEIYPSLIFSGELEKQVDTDIKGKIGFEYGKYWEKNRYILRAGYKMGYDEDSFTCGLGYEFSRFKFDYGVGMMGDLGLIHKISFAIKFST